MEHHEHHHDHDARRGDCHLPDRHRRPCRRRRRPRWWSSPTASRSRSGSPPSPSGSAMTPSDDRLQRLRPRPDAAGAAGLGAHRGRRQRGRPRGDRPLARAATGEPLRRHARDAGADTGRRPVLVPDLFPDPASTGTTRTSARTTARSWAVREHPGRSGGARLLAVGAPGAGPDPRRRLHRGRRDRSVQPPGDDVRGDGPLRQRHARRRRDGAVIRGSAWRGRSPLPDEHGQHACVQRGVAGGAHEVGRRRQRPGRARGDRRVGRARAVGARGRGRAVRRAGTASLEHRTPEQTYTLGTFDVAGEPATPPLADEFAVLRANPEWAAERQRLEAYVDAAPDKTVAFVAEMDMGMPEGDVVTAATCIRRS